VTAIYTGMRKGELFALQKSDVDFDAGLILKRAIAASSSELVFPAEDGSMLPKHTKLEEVLRRAMRRAGLVTGYVYKCRREGCGHREASLDANLGRCVKCRFKLFPVGEVRKIRFHHLRHTTASLLLMSGADLAAVQRIMRHQDPRLTTEVYGHLSTNYLKKEIERLSFDPPAAEETKSLPSAGGRIGAAAARRHPRWRALSGSIYYPATTRPPDPAPGARPTANRWKAITRT
jgi:integrase